MNILLQDTVDILVGWFVDPSQPVKVIRAATKALQLLRPFWKEDLAFSKTLLSQFLEDLDDYAAVFYNNIFFPQLITLLK